MTQQIIDGILKKVDNPHLIDLLVNRLSFGELQSLLLRTYELKTAQKGCSDLLKEYQTNRFTKPSDIDPKTQRLLELKAFSLLPQDFVLIDFSPLTPLGTTSVMAPVHQNNVVSTIRNVEVAADTTNILALECARRRQLLLRDDSKTSHPVKLCSSQRLTRGQPFENDNFSAHFNVVALCTAGRDEGNNQFEIENLIEHIRFYINLLEQNVELHEVKQINIKLYDFDGSENAGVIDHVQSKVVNHKLIRFIIEGNSDFGRNYYSRLRFMISVVNHQGEEFDYIDGGFVDWTSRLLNNRKERLLTSGIGTDYLLRTIQTNVETGQ